MSSIEKRVKVVIAEHLAMDMSLIRNEATFAGDLGADSLDIYELVMELEEEFNTEILDGSAGKILSVQDAINFISLQPLS